jgi:hypothetical protein
VAILVALVLPAEETTRKYPAEQYQQIRSIVLVLLIREIKFTIWSVIVEGIPRDMSWQDLKDLFRPVCKLDYVDVHRDREGRNVGYVKTITQFLMVVLESLRY